MLLSQLARRVVGRAAVAQCRAVAAQAQAVRMYSTEDHSEILNAEREAMPYDVVIVGAGPAGLAAAIKVKQLCLENEVDYSVCVLEKGAEVGAHILSGNVFEPRAMDELFPEWRTMDNGPPIETEVKEDVFLVLPDDTHSVAIPQFLLPPTLHNDGNYIISLSKLARWLAEQAEELGVEVFPGFSASEVLYSEDGAVRGIATRDMGVAKDGTPSGQFARGMELHARQTIFAEGARGSCSEEVMAKFNLREGAQPQTFGIGVKEVWQVPEENLNPGFVQHTLGWPLQSGLFDKNFGGSFLYHMAPNLVLIGFVVGLDYENPHLSPYQEFQRWKHHPDVSKHLEGGTCIQYGARCLNEGGFHALPKLTFPGGALAGCSAGFLNSVKIKGSHTALKSGMVCGEEIFTSLQTSEDMPVYESYEITEGQAGIEVDGYQTAMEDSWVYEELKEVRNCHASFHFGTVPGMIYTAASTFFLKGKEPWTLPHNETDSAKTGLVKNFEPIEYPKPDGKISFSLLDNLALSGTNHGEQPSHLRIKPELAAVPESVSLQVHGGPEQNFCPAKVYEYDENDKLVINAQNCLHCKACSIKMPQEYINWTVPEGGGGPAYELM